MPGTPGHPRQYEILASSVIDHVTGLEWERTPTASLYTWDDAQTHCEALELDGNTGWRAPARIELVSLLDLGLAAPRVDPDVFGGELGVQWTMSTADNPDKAWIVPFSDAGTALYAVAKTTTLPVRCVRTETPPPAITAQFVNNGDGTVSDAVTGLMWLEQPTNHTLSSALGYCADLSYAEHDDWALPTVTELLTLIDESATNPALDPSVFVSVQGLGYYASTDAVIGGTQTWTVHIYRGEVFAQTSTSTPHVRCVRRP
jgi:hypothetical protein